MNSLEWRFWLRRQAAREGADAQYGLNRLYAGDLDDAAEELAWRDLARTLNLEVLTL